MYFADITLIYDWIKVVPGNREDTNGFNIGEGTSAAKTIFVANFLLNLFKKKIISE